jgi:deferrochelatase/peroxidase EfeB
MARLRHGFGGRGRRQTAEGRNPVAAFIDGIKKGDVDTSPAIDKLIVTENRYKFLLSFWIKRSCYSVCQVFQVIYRHHILVAW